MDISRKKNIIFLLLFLAVFVSSAFAADYFPLKIGNSWVYQTNTGIKMKVEVSGKEKIGEQEYFIVQSWIGDGLARVDYYAKQNDRVICKKVKDFSGARETEITYFSPVVLLKFPMYTGAKWSQEFKQQLAVNGIKQQPVSSLEESSVTLKEQIKVAAGTFNCFKVEAILRRENGREYKDNYWYADKVGLVKKELPYLDSFLGNVFELQEFKLK